MFLHHHCLDLVLRRHSLNVGIHTFLADFELTRRHIDLDYTQHLALFNLAGNLLAREPASSLCLIETLIQLDFIDIRRHFCRLLSVHLLSRLLLDPLIRVNRSGGTPVMR